MVCFLCFFCNLLGHECTNSGLTNLEEGEGRGREGGKEGKGREGERKEKVNFVIILQEICMRLERRRASITPSTFP